MISFFEHIAELAASSGIRFQVCFSSRHYPYITIRKGLDLVLEGQEGHTQDITNYLETELKIGKSNIAQQIRGKIQEKASGVFMWVVLVVEILNREHDRGRMHALRRRLQEIPSDLHELFRDILTRDSRNTDELVLCIQWVLFAKQPLSPEQLYFAILSGVETDVVSIWDPSEITRDVIKRFILDSSKGLTEITTSKLQKVQFIHESVRDFLLKEDGLSSIWPDLRSNLQG
ncbi:HET-domain-containing protein [Botryosphaeria dothidea]|uniref:HET-domain-containing protein n=1 Tax=Botryosphaeria dothidea TaxID=55169 RepID=A0A8H4J3Y9_9PEZI|nr:HET-domain-containing protein [Botryosphaeria dothidea]